MFENRFELTGLFEVLPGDARFIGIDFAGQSNDQPCFFKRFAYNGDLVRSFVWIEATANLCSKVEICRVDPAAREDGHAAGKNHFARSDRHQDLRWAIL